MIPMSAAEVCSPGFSRRGDHRNYQHAPSPPAEAGTTNPRPQTRGSCLRLGILTTFLLAHTANAEITLPDKPISDPAELKAFLDKRPYEIGFHAKLLGSDKTLDRHGDRPVCLASTVKVFCLTELLRQKLEEDLDLSDEIEVPNHGKIPLEKAASLMIGQSDNEATNALAEFLGRRKVNGVPAKLGIKGLSREVLPGPEKLRAVLDKRISGKKIARSGLDQHGTAIGIAEYYELLAAKKVVSEPVSDALLEFYTKHPKPFSQHHAKDFEFLGKGGNLLWTRPPKHYSMMGWGLLLQKEGQPVMALCVWGEWFPEDMPPKEQSKFLKFVTDCVIDCSGGL